MIGPEAAVTFDRLEGFSIVKSLGYAYGQATKPQNLLRSTFRSIGAFIGLGHTDFLTDAERVRNECLDELLRRADGMGANAVVNLQFHATEQSDGSTRLLAFGEAVVLAPAPSAETRT